MIKNNVLKKLMFVFIASLAINNTMCVDEEELSNNDNADETAMVRANICQLAVMRAASASRRCCNVLNSRIDTIEELIESLTDTSAECCSVVNTIETELISQIDSFSDCCSVTETLVGTLDETCTIIPPSLVNDADFNILKWLKTIYCLSRSIRNCLTACP